MGVAASGRLLIVSNRLPVTVRVEKGRPKLVESMGGLATGMRPAHERTRGLWFGWPGAVRRLDPRQRRALEAELARRHLVPIHLTQAELRRYYHGYSNGVLWPLFHYALDRLPLASSDWSEYRRVNERFADAVAKEYRPGDLVWVHDYQLALVPALLRERVPKARIAFFLHTPFPASEVYRVLPQRAEILRGILGADLVGFHTLSYLRHFSVSVLRLLGQETDIDRIWHEERDVRLGVYPMGIDVQAFEAAAQDPKVIAESETIRRQAGGASIVLGVDRLDYSKGIPRRLLAFERLLQREPDLRGRVRFIQVAAPSRGEIRAYADFERTVAELVGRINGQYGTAAWTPIQYLHQAVPQKRVVALYRAADVMAVTPLRDGLNLVAKEYVASRPDLGGCLLLSEFAGAAADMPEAVVVNPFDLDGMAKSMVEAVRMDASERARRMRALRERLQQGDVHRWCQTILDDLRGATAPRPTAPRVLAAEVLEKLLVQARTAERTVIFLDYDGTLVPIRPHPDLAAPDARLLVLLRQLGQRPGTSVHVVSGRDAETLERWLGSSPVALHAEHGLASRPLGESPWRRTVPASDRWKGKIRPLLDAFTRVTPGSFVEEKSAGLVWHFAQAEREFGPAQALELRLHLLEVLSNVPVSVSAGKRVVEIRPQGVDKGTIVGRVLADEPEDATVLAFGDDVTDEDMFAAIPDRGWSIHVGPARSRAPWRVRDCNAVRSVLKRLAATPPVRAPGRARSTAHPVRT